MGKEVALGTDADADHSLIQQLGAEAVGTFMLVFVSAGAGIVPHATGTPAELVAQALARGLIVTVMIYTLGGISGAHLNPAITYTFALRNAFPWTRVAPYWAAQLGGALLAAAALRLFFGDALIFGITSPGPGVSKAVAFGTEVLFALLLVAVILGTAEEAQLVGPNAALAVGGSIVLCVCLGDAVSGASMNPFRSLAPALLAGQLSAVWIYLIAPFIGGSLAAGLTWLFHGQANVSEKRAGRGRT